MKGKIAIISQSSSTAIDPEEVLFIESYARKVSIITIHGTYTQYGHLEKIRDALGDKFCWVLKNKTINLDMIKEIKNGIIIFKNDEKMILAELAFRKAKQGYNKYLRETTNNYFV